MSDGPRFTQVPVEQFNDAQKRVAERVLKVSSAGLAPELAEDVRNGRRPANMKPDEEVVYDVVTELLRDRNLTDSTFERATKILGEQPTIDLVAVAGFYMMVSALLIAGRVSPPDGTRPLPMLIKK